MSAPGDLSGPNFRTANFQESLIRTATPTLNHCLRNGWPGPCGFHRKGDRIAFVEHTYFGGDGTITVLDLNGRVTARSEKFALVLDVARSPDGREGRVLLGRTDDRDSVEFLGRAMTCPAICPGWTGPL